VRVREIVDSGKVECKVLPAKGYWVLISALKVGLYISVYMSFSCMPMP
jgi:hypothetical protein